MRLLPRANPNIVIVVIPAYVFKQFVIVDLVGSSVIYWAFDRYLQSVPVATIWSIGAPIIVNRQLKWMRRRKHR